MQRFEGLVEVGRVALDHAVPQDQRPPGVAGDLLVVRDQDHRQPFVLVELPEQVDHLAAGSRVEVAGRLVAHQDRRGGNECAGDRDPLLLPAGELPGVMVQPVAQSDPFEQPDRLGPLRPARSTASGAIQQRQLDVFDGRRSHQQVEALEDEPDLPVADAGPLVAAHRGDLDAVEPVAAAGRPVQAAQGVHQCRLAGPGRADQRDILAPLDRERRWPQGGDLHLADVVDLADVGQFDQGHDLSLSRDRSRMSPDADYGTESIASSIQPSPVWTKFLASGNWCERLSRKCIR